MRTAHKIALLLAAAFIATCLTASVGTADTKDNWMMDRHHGKVTKAVALRRIEQIQICCEERLNDLAESGKSGEHLNDALEHVKRVCTKEVSWEIERFVPEGVRNRRNGKCSFVRFCLMNLRCHLKSHSIHSGILPADPSRKQPCIAPLCLSRKARHVSVPPTPFSGKSLYVTNGLVVKELLCAWVVDNGPLWCTHGISIK